ncbi:MAG: Gfo/Idh/MocA family oxidoreductase [Kiritimatiellia bacterium]|jgi:predicted dehydrogenase|nr:Gfo/Idh/MocA family oxidoreductase [Kiritimatiellia bacterium]MDP6849266.1 Gfo/Idh/MocA family oxidoreductase [Kiritimatiellia bacterium]
MKKLRVGIVGMGMGRHHAKDLHSHSRSDLVAIVDADESRLEESAGQFPESQQYTDYEKMLAEQDLDMVVLAIPNFLHKPFAIAALEAGCHVLCEKPMAMNTAEAEEMLAVARKSDRRLMINFSYRFTGAAHALKQAVDAGVLGDVYYGRTGWLRRDGMPGFGGWFGQKNKSGGGPLIDLGVHKIDLALWLMGYPSPEWILARTYDHLGKARAEGLGKDFDVEDFAAALVTFDNGATLDVTVSWASHIKEKELMETRILGTKGGVVHRNINEGYEFEGEIFTDFNGVPSNIQPQPRGCPLGSSMTHFVDCILDDKPHIATGEEGATLMRILDAIYESAASREPVRVGRGS